MLWCDAGGQLEPTTWSFGSYDAKLGALPEERVSEFSANLAD